MGSPVSERDLAGQVVAGDIFTVAKHLPSAFVDLLILDPPYNIVKEFNGRIFRKRPADEYRRWFQELVDLLWSMPENTDHPTQKPEKLMAKLILASSRPGDYVFDPFLGSGTTAVVAEKLSRRWCGVEIDAEYQCLALKRLAAARTEPSIQGYADGVFWDRNALSGRTRRIETESTNGQSDLFS